MQIDNVGGKVKYPLMITLVMIFATIESLSSSNYIILFSEINIVLLLITFS